MQYDILEEKEQACQQVSQQVAQELETFLTPLLYKTFHGMALRTLLGEGPQHY
jgi:hypothetical protein